MNTPKPQSATCIHSTHAHCPHPLRPFPVVQLFMLLKGLGCLLLFKHMHPHSRGQALAQLRAQYDWDQRSSSWPIIGLSALAGSGRGRRRLCAGPGGSAKQAAPLPSPVLLLPVTVLHFLPCLNTVVHAFACMLAIVRFEMSRNIVRKVMRKPCGHNLCFDSFSSSANESMQLTVHCLSGGGMNKSNIIR